MTYPLPPKFKLQPHFMGITPRGLGRWAGTLTLWGATVGILAVYILEPVPLMRQDVLQKIPVIGPYWDRTVAKEDNPY